MKRSTGPQPIPGMRFATIDDFRIDGQLIVDIEYFECLIGPEHEWVRRWTSPETDRESFKIKIHLNYICVAHNPTRYNQNLQAYLDFAEGAKELINTN